MTFVLERIASPEETHFLTQPNRQLELLDPPRPLTLVNYLIDQLRCEFVRAKPKPRRVRFLGPQNLTEYKIAIAPSGERLSKMCNLRWSFEALSKEHEAFSNALMVLKREFEAVDARIKFIPQELVDADGLIRHVTYPWIFITF